jgi:site-specific DNA-methyltransferase (cytosine-N4-specific)
MLSHPAYTTALGTCYHADALSLLATLPDESVNLVLTSPPYALHRKKAYGNVSPEEYIDWLLPFTEEFHRVLRPDGSFVFEISSPWKRGSGTRSLDLYRLILRLCEKFHLCQELYWHNPSKLPSPAEYVTVRRTRLKDSVNVVWWLGKTADPKADNRRVLRPYSRSMRRLIRDGMQPVTRPSQHHITAGISRDNGGAIPPSLLEIPNTASADPYLARCRKAGLVPHPARFPPGLPDFVIRLLTEPGDLVVDPFAGSNVTGHVAERLGRRWIACDLDGEYVRGSRLRFDSLAGAESEIAPARARRAG